MNDCESQTEAISFRISSLRGRNCFFRSKKGTLVTRLAGNIRCRVALRKPNYGTAIRPVRAQKEGKTISSKPLLASRTCPVSLLVKCQLLSFNGLAIQPAGYFNAN